MFGKLLVPQSWPEPMIELIGMKSDVADSFLTVASLFWFWRISINELSKDMSESWLVYSEAVEASTVNKKS